MKIGIPKIRRKKKKKRKPIFKRERKMGKTENISHTKAKEKGQVLIEEEVELENLPDQDEFEIPLVGAAFKLWKPKSPYGLAAKGIIKGVQKGIGVTRGVVRHFENN